jgi:hypothetical protein
MGSFWAYRGSRWLEHFTFRGIFSKTGTFPLLLCIGRVFSHGIFFEESKAALDNVSGG